MGHSIWYNRWIASKGAVSVNASHKCSGESNELIYSINSLENHVLSQILPQNIRTSNEFMYIHHVYIHEVNENNSMHTIWCTKMILLCYRRLLRINKIYGICISVPCIKLEHVDRLMYGHLISNRKINHQNGHWPVLRYCCKFKAYGANCKRWWHKNMDALCNSYSGPLDFKIFIFIYYAKKLKANDDK